MPAVTRSSTVLLCLQVGEVTESPYLTRNAFDAHELEGPEEEERVGSSKKEARNHEKESGTSDKRYTFNKQSTTLFVCVAAYDTKCGLTTSSWFDNTYAPKRLEASCWGPIPS